MTTTEKIEPIKAISAAVPVLGTFAERGAAVAKLGEIIASLDPTCKCKIIPPRICTSTWKDLSLPNTTPAS